MERSRNYTLIILLIISGLIMLSSCGNEDISLETERTDSQATVSINSILTGTYINALSASSFRVQGECSESGGQIVVSGDMPSKSTTCLGGGWVVPDLDFSGSLDGSIVIQAIHTDSYGDTASDMLLLMLDTIAPSAPSGVTLVTPVTTPGSDATPTINVSGVETGSTLYVYRTAGCSDLVSTGISSTFQLDLTTATLSDGSYDFYIIEEDAAGNSSGCYSTGTIYTLQTIAPTITNVTSSTANGAYTVFDPDIPIQITFSSGVIVTGTPKLILDTGNGEQEISYATGSGSSTLTFTYVIANGAETTDLDYVDENSLSLNGGTIKDQAGNDAVLTLPTPGATGSLGANKDIVISTAPTIINVYSSSIDGEYSSPEVVDIKIVFSENITVAGGPPQLTLETGFSDAVVNCTGDGSATVTCSYTIDSDDNSLDLEYYSTGSFALNGATIQDIGFNNAILTLPAIGGGKSLSDNSNIVVDNAPVVVSASSTEADGTYASGDIDVSLTFSKTVYVDTSSGTPYFLMETGVTDRQAVYISGSGTGNLVFRYAIMSGDTSSDLDYVAGAIQLDSGTIKDAPVSGKDAVLALPAPAGGNSLADSKDIVIDTIPIVVSVISTDGNYGNTDTVDVELVFSEVVNVAGGVPSIMLETGAVDSAVNYSSGTGTDTLVFQYTVDAGDESSDLDYVLGSVIALNGATIQDADGIVDDAILSLPAVGFGSLADNQNIVIDAVSPTIVSASSTMADGNYAAGGVIDVKVVFSEIINVAGGTPRITLETGVIDQVVDCASGSGTNTLTCQYTVQTGDISADLDYATSTSFDLNGSTVRDALGNDAVVLLPVPGMAGSLGNNKNFVIDGDPPTVTNVTSSNADATYGGGQVVYVQIDFSEIVKVVGGTPKLLLETGATDQYALYDSGSQTTSLVFKYTVQTGDVTADLDYTAIDSIDLDGSFIQDSFNNSAVLTLPVPSAAGSLGANKAIVIDGICPTVVSASSTMIDGTYGPSSNIDVNLVFSENVVVDDTGGTPILAMETGTIDQNITYTSYSGNVVTFSYTVVSGDESSDLDYVDASSLSLNGGTIKDVNGNDLSPITLPTPGGGNSLADIKDIVIDAVGPAILSASTTAVDGSYGVGEAIDFVITFNEAVTVVGSPELATNSGGKAVYSAGSGTASLTFQYVVASSDASTDLDYVATDSLTLAGGTMKDAQANDAELTLPAVGTISGVSAIVIDGVAPTVTNITTSTPDGTYGVKTIDIEVTFSEDVIVAGGPPQLTLETGTVDQVIDYVSGSGGSTLTFQYITQVGDNTLDLDCASSTAISLNGGTVTDDLDNSPNSIVLILPTSGAPGSLGANKNIAIDMVAPTVTSVDLTTSDGSYGIDSEIFLTVTFSENIDVAGASPLLTLETGASDKDAVYQSGTGSNILTFKYVVEAGDNSLDLDYENTNVLSSTGTVLDLYSNAADFTLPALPHMASKSDVVIDAVQPIVTSVTSAVDDDTYVAGDVIDVQVVFDDTITVTGTPQLQLETGRVDRIVNYLSGTGTNTLIFRYTVLEGDNSLDLNYDGNSALLLNGGTLMDALNNSADVDLAAAISLDTNKDIVISELSVDGGGDHTCFSHFGIAQCWGGNGYGQLGNGQLTDSSTFVNVEGLGSGSGVAQISAGFEHSCAVVNGGAMCWGRNNGGQLGNNNVGVDSNIPVTVVDVAAPIANVVHVAAGHGFACAVVNGSVQCWGENQVGQLGNNNVGTDSPFAVDVEDIATLALTGMAYVKIGKYHACGLKDDGTVWCWGQNDRGQLGNGETTLKGYAVEVLGITDAIQISLGDNYSCALLQSGGVKCWGSNSDGRLGDNSGTDQPSPVSVLTTADGNPPLADIVQIASGYAHNCALKNDGTSVCWGVNTDGKLGDGTIVPAPLPVSVYGLTAMSLLMAGEHHSCAINNGALKCWGRNDNGQLGDGTTSNALTAIGTTVLGAPFISSYYTHSCMTFDGNVKCWGEGANGQLGNGSTADQYVPVDVVTFLGGSLLSSVSALSVGSEFSCATTKGGAKCWGLNSVYQLGTDLGDSEFPAPINSFGAIGSGVTHIATGNQHGCAFVHTVGGGGSRTVCWGSNSSGQLGDNNVGTDASSPVDVLTGAALLDDKVSQLGAGDAHSCALEEGLVKCWGENGDGQLGDTTIIDAPTPVLAVGLTGIVEIAVGANHACARDDSGDVWCWGDNTYGQIGDGLMGVDCTTPYKIVDVTVAAQATRISAGSYHTCAVVSEKVLCWGRGSSGQLGNNSTDQSDDPVYVLTSTGGAQLTGATVISAGSDFSCTMSFISGSIGTWCWGENSSYQLGDGTGNTTDSLIALPTFSQ